MANGYHGKLASEISGDIPGKFWHGLIWRKSVNAVAGPSGYGKSTIVQKMVADLTGMGHFVIYCNAEDDPAMQRYRFEAAGAKLDRILLARFVAPDDLKDLERTILANAASLVVFDTAAKHIAGPMQRWDRPLSAVADVMTSTDCAALYVHHTNKNVKKSMDWRAAIGGATSGLVGTSRGIALVGVRPDDPSQRLWCPVKNAYGVEDKALAFEFQTEEYDQTVGDAIEVSYMHLAETGIEVANPTALVVVAGDGDGKRGPSPEKAAEGNEFLCTVLANGPVARKDVYRCKDNPDSSRKPTDADWKSRECGFLAAKAVATAGGCCPDCGGVVIENEGIESMAEAAGVSMGTIKRCKAALTIESGKKGFSERAIGYWMLPTGHPALEPTAIDFLA